MAGMIKTSKLGTTITKEYLHEVAEKNGGQVTANQQKELGTKVKAAEVLINRLKWPVELACEATGLDIELLRPVLEKHMNDRD